MAVVPMTASETVKAPSAIETTSLELTILMPCLNEAETIEICVRKAKSWLDASGVSGEVLIADNGSRDGSQALAEACGARVIAVPEKGYGAALMGGIRGARQPWRVVLTRSGNLPPDAHLFTDEHRDRTLVYQEKSMEMVLQDLGKRGVTSLLLEGGGEVIGAAFDEQWVNAVQFYIAPLIIGTGKPVVAGQGKSAVQIKNAVYKKIGEDIRVTGDACY